jgi:PilZ domain
MFRQFLRTLFGLTPQTDRRHHRRTYDRPIKIKMGGNQYETLDWSLGGFRFNGYHRTLEIGERLSGKIGPVDGIKAGDFIVEVVRTTDEGDVGVRIIEISSEVFLAMSGLKNC